MAKWLWQFINRDRLIDFNRYNKLNVSPVSTVPWFLPSVVSTENIKNSQTCMLWTINMATNCMHNFISLSRSLGVVPFLVLFFCFFFCFFFNYIICWRCMMKVLIRFWFSIDNNRTFSFAFHTGEPHQSWHEYVLLNICFRFSLGYSKNTFKYF